MYGSRFNQTHYNKMMGIFIIKRRIILILIHSRNNYNNHLFFELIYKNINFTQHIMMDSKIFLTKQNTDTYTLFYNHLYFMIIGFLI